MRDQKCQLDSGAMCLTQDEPIGPTREEALAEVERTIDAYQEEHGPLPAHLWHDGVIVISRAPGGNIVLVLDRKRAMRPGELPRNVQEALGEVLARTPPGPCLPVLAVVLGGVFGFGIVKGAAKA